MRMTTDQFFVVAAPSVANFTVHPLHECLLAGGRVTPLDVMLVSIEKINPLISIITPREGKKNWQLFYKSFGVE